MLRREAITIRRRLPNGTHDFIFSDQRFEIGGPGIFVVDGPNQAGKSLLVRLIVGALPPFVEDQGGSNLYLYNNPDPLTLRRVQQAARHGIGCVFQLDTLVPSMTIAEQIRLRHTPSLLVRILKYAKKKTIDHEVGEIAGDIGGADIVEPVQSYIDNIIDSFSPSNNKLIERTEKLLESFGEDNSLLSKTPDELSGGARAVARLVSTLLIPNLRILFLDEAFAHVDPKRWPIYVDQLKRWVEYDLLSGERLVPEQARAIIAITHNEPEKLYWEPRGRFRVEDRQIRPYGSVGHASIHKAHPRRRDSIALFIFPPPESATVPLPTGRSLVLISSAVHRMYPEEIQDICELLRQWTGHEPTVRAVDSGERIKHLAGLDQLLTLIHREFISLPDRISSLVVVGGGSVLNAAMLAAGLVFRGRLPLVVIPTTYTALADVAIGSKAGINYKIDHSGETVRFKNSIGMYVDPSAIILYDKLFSRLPEREVVLGLVESLKHFLLQDADQFQQCLACWDDPPGSRDKAWSLAHDTLTLKAALLRREPWEYGVGRILRYGHLIGHALERASGFAIPHTSAILYGILVDLNLAGDGDVERTVLRSILKHRELLGVDQWNDVPEGEVIAAIERDHADFDGGHYEVVLVPSIGCYSRSPLRVASQAKTVAEIKEALRNVDRSLGFGE